MQFSDATYLAWLTGFIVLSGLALFMQGKQKRLAVDLLLVFATLFVAGSLYTAFEGRKGGNAAYLEADKAELSLRMNSAFISIKRRMPADSALDRQFKHFSKDTYEQAEKCLSKAIAASPDSAVLHAKEIILLAEEGKGIKKPIEQLKSLGGSEENQAKGKALADLIGKIYIDQKISADQLPAMRKILEKNVPPGWYRDILNVQIENAAGRKQEFQQRLSEFFDNYFNYLIRVMLYVCAALFAFLAGLFVIVVQLIFLGRTPTDENHRQLIAAAGDWTWRAVYGVFIAWLSAEFIVAPLLKGATKQLASIATEHGALSVAFLTAGLYLLQNLPALLFIYLFAFRPAQLQFLEGIKLRLRIGNLGPVRLVLAGVLTWFAAVPLVVVATFIAAKLGSTGSANPIVAIVLSAAKESNALSTVMFLITLGVLPAICEETLFRGFLYTSLRRRLSVFPAVVLSGALFSLAHLDLGGALQLFILGCLFAFVLERTKSLIPSMVAHCMWNCMSFITAVTIFG